RIFDEAGVEILLVGDSASNVMAGNETTLPLTLNQMIFMASSVARAAKRALVVVDLTFGYYEGDEKEALNSAVRVLKESRALAVEIEVGVQLVDAIKRIISSGIPFMAPLGPTPQSINKFGSYGVRAKESAASEKLFADAKAIEDAACSATVLEKIPAQLAQ